MTMSDTSGLGADLAQRMAMRCAERDAADAAEGRTSANQCAHGQFERSCEVCESDAIREMQAETILSLEKRMIAAEQRAEAAESGAAALREALEWAVSEWGGVDHHKDDCPEPGECEDCRLSKMFNDALATDAGAALLERLRGEESMVAQLMDDRDALRSSLAACRKGNDEGTALLTAMVADRSEVERLKKLAQPNQREHDLVRQQRMELHREQLITDAEYCALASEHGGVQRLEDYDQIQAEVDRLRGALESLKLVADLRALAATKGGG